MIQMHLSTKQKQTHRNKEQTCSCQGGAEEGRGSGALGLADAADGNCSHEIKRRLLLGRKVMTNLDNMTNLEKQRHYFANKGPSSQGYGFSSDHVWM